MKTPHKAKLIILQLSILYLTLIIPTITFTHTTQWYSYNYLDTSIQKQITKEHYQSQINNLLSYLKYQTDLNENWTPKEKSHYHDVRNIYLILILIALTASMTTIKLLPKRAKKLSKISLINIIIIIIVSAILFLNFKTFWNNIFHSLLFTDNNWQMTPDDTSYYLFPLKFFSNTTIAILISSITINLCIYCGSQIHKLIKKNK